MSAPSDIEIIKYIFESPEKSKSFIDSFKPAIIGVVLMILLNLPIVTKFINSCGCDSTVTNYAIKGLIFIILFYLLTQSKKNPDEQ